MEKNIFLIIANQDELIRVSPERIVYIASDGNYSTLIYIGNGYDGYGLWGNTIDEKPLLNRSKLLIAEAGKTMENSKNPAIRAKYDWYKNVVGYSDSAYYIFIDKYKNNTELQQFLSECDCLKSYYTDTYLPAYSSKKWAYEGNSK